MEFRCGLLPLLRDQSGASASEYALLLALVGTGLALSANNPGKAVGQGIRGACDCVKWANGAKEMGLCRPRRGR